MTRRGFFGLLAGATAVDPERLLWVPGQKTISIPTARVIGVETNVLGDGRWHYIAVDLDGTVLSIDGRPVNKPQSRWDLTFASL